MDAMISKLAKNGHRVYLLTGQKNNRSSYKKVFEKYDFPYDSGSIKDIFESTRPDVVVFMGAFDTNFDWKEDARQESVRYVAGIVNPNLPKLLYIGFKLIPQIPYKIGV